MGEIAGKYSDYCIITEDNNRYEDFDDIANDILVGMNKTNCEYKIIPDRKEAIKYAKNNLNAKEINLGVFDNNKSAFECYKAVGFEVVSMQKGAYQFYDEQWDCAEMVLKK